MLLHSKGGDNMNTRSLLFLFLTEILKIIDEGETATIPDIIEAYDNNILEYFNSVHGFSNINSDMNEYQLILPILNEQYVSENEAMHRGINNNGLVYLAHVVLEAFEYYTREY